MENIVDESDIISSCVVLGHTLQSINYDREIISRIRSAQHQLKSWSKLPPPLPTNPCVNIIQKWDSSSPADYELDSLDLKHNRGTILCYINNVIDQTKTSNHPKEYNMIQLLKCGYSNLFFIIYMSFNHFETIISTPFNNLLAAAPTSFLAKNFTEAYASMIPIPLILEKLDQILATHIERINLAKKQKYVNFGCIDDSLNLEKIISAYKLKTNIDCSYSQLTLQMKEMVPVKNEKNGTYHLSVKLPELHIYNYHKFCIEIKWMRDLPRYYYQAQVSVNNAMANGDKERKMQSYTKVLSMSGGVAEEKSTLKYKCPLWFSAEGITSINIVINFTFFPPPDQDMDIFLNNMVMVKTFFKHIMYALPITYFRFKNCINPIFSFIDNQNITCNNI